MSTVVVTGSRSWSDVGTIRAALWALPRTSTIITGGAEGADTMAANAARALGLNLEVMRPDWDRYGKRAGIIRNCQMLGCRPDMVYAFWDGKSRGTRHCFEEAERRGIEVFHFGSRP